MSLQRAVTEMTIGHVEALEERRTLLGVDQLSELEDQFQITVSGSAGTQIGWDSVDLDFDVEFVYAPEQRDSSLVMPHFTYGAVITGADAGAGDDLTLGVVITAAVRQWKVDDDTGVCNGAIVLIGACAPGSLEVITYDGFVHLSFQGFGAPLEVATSDVDVS